MGHLKKKKKTMHETFYNLFLQVVFHYQSITEPAVIKRLNSQLNKSTGEVVKSRPKYVCQVNYIKV